MKICGIIAEYNPFHEGHAYQLREAGRLSGADAVVVVMSGHFVQRGEPAIFDPYTRAEAALKSGADVVFMMPPNASTASAEGFASYGVALLDTLGCDYISCGIEPNRDAARLNKLAEKLADEDEDMSVTMRNALKSGSSYPAALAMAAGIGQLGPNSILAIEYLKAMRRLGSSMEFVPVARIGSGYNDTEITEGIYPSATALRKKMLGDPNLPTTDIYNISVSGQPLYPISPDDMMPMIIESIRNHIDELETYADCSPEIASRIRSKKLHYHTFEEMVTDLKTKDVTYTRVARVLTHILLNIRQEDVPQISKIVGAKDESTIYAQLIGFSNSNVLKELSIRNAQKKEDIPKTEGSLKTEAISETEDTTETKDTSQDEARTDGKTIISKAADHKDILAGAAYATEVYNQALWNKYRVEGKDFYRQQILRI